MPSVYDGKQLLCEGVVFILSDFFIKIVKYFVFANVSAYVWGIRQVPFLVNL